MKIYNTINVKSELVEIIAGVVMPPDIPEIRSITLRNKQEGLVHGQWGQFLPLTYEITLCVPRELIFPYKSAAPITKQIRSFNDITEFLAAIIGHEYKHAWQHVHEKEVWHVSDYLEVGAERYEAIAIEKWQMYKAKNDLPAAATREVKQRLTYREQRELALKQATKEQK